MQDDRFKIFVHRLKEGQIEVLEETFSPDFIEVEEEELQFVAPVVIRGEAFVSGADFVLQLAISTQATMRCGICNEKTVHPIEVINLTHTQKMSEIKSGVFYMQDTMREAILLELPSKVECNLGRCPERATIEKYFVKEKKYGSSKKPLI